jgi:hypothetical protein
MNRFLSSTIAAILAAVVVVGSTSAQQLYTLEAPAAIRDAIERIETGKRPSEAIRILSERDDAAPYLRMALTTAVEPRVKRDLTEALDGIEARAYERNLARAEWWAKTRRLDLYTEFLSCCRKRDAGEVVDWLTPVTREILNDAAEQLGTTNRTPSVTFKVSGFTDLSGEEVTVPVKPFHNVLIRARDCTFELAVKLGMMVAIRGRMSDPLATFNQKTGTVGEWFKCNLLVNSSIPLATCNNTLVVCAGDIELTGWMRDAVIIAGGSIRSGKGNTSIHHSMLCAGGDVELYERDVGNNIVHALGSATFAGKSVAPHENVREKRKALPYGIRFVSPNDFGIEVAAQNGGVQIMGLTPDSPFAKHGVKDADVIVRIDDVEADSVATFSHQLRRGVLRESVVLHIQRGKERITRIVFLDGIPLPAAPAPRELRR